MVTSRGTESPVFEPLESSRAKMERPSSGHRWDVDGGIDYPSVAWRFAPCRSLVQHVGTTLGQLILMVNGVTIPEYITSPGLTVGAHVRYARSLEETPSLGRAHASQTATRTGLDPPFLLAPAWSWSTPPPMQKLRLRSLP